MAYFPVRGLFCYVPPESFVQSFETEDKLSIWKYHSSWMDFTFSIDNIQYYTCFIRLCLVKLVNF